MKMTAEEWRKAITPTESRGTVNGMGNGTTRQPRFQAKHYDDGTWDLYAKDTYTIKDVLRDRGWTFVREDPVSHERNIWTFENLTDAVYRRECDWIWSNGWKVNGRTGEEVMP